MKVYIYMQVNDHSPTNMKYENRIAVTMESTEKDTSGNVICIDNSTCQYHGH